MLLTFHSKCLSQDTAQPSRHAAAIFAVSGYETPFETRSVTISTIHFRKDVLYRPPAHVAPQLIAIHKRHVTAHAMTVQTLRLHGVLPERLRDQKDFTHVMPR